MTMKKKRKKRYQFKKKFVKMIEKRTFREVMHFYLKEANDMILDLPPLTETDKLFVVSDNVDDPCLNRNPQIREIHLTEAYFGNAIHLLDMLEKTNNNPILDGYIYPALFSFRHSLELIMKDTLNKKAGQGNVSQVVKDKVHCLKDIWDEYKKIVPNDKEKMVIERLINELSDLDPTSFNFRYTYDVFGKNIWLSLRDEEYSVKEDPDHILDQSNNRYMPILIDKRILKMTMLKMYNYFEGINELTYNSEKH